jgi:hypothetical protein
MVGIHRRGMQPTPSLPRHPIPVAAAVAIIALCGRGVPSRGTAFALSPSSSYRRPPRRPAAVVASTSSSSAEVVSASAAPATVPAADAIVVGGKRKRTLRIAVVGTGAVGSYYGGRLWEGGGGGGVDDRGDDRAVETSVTFHLRGEHYDHCMRHGMRVSSCHGDFSIPPSKLSAHRTTEDMARSLLAGGECFDWVVCALKSTSVSVPPFPCAPARRDRRLRRGIAPFVPSSPSAGAFRVSLIDHAPIRAARMRSSTMSRFSSSPSSPPRPASL